MRAEVRVERWMLAKPFIIARGAETAFELVVVELEKDGAIGRGEACPVPHFGESTASVLASIEAMLAPLRSGADWDLIHDGFEPGAARNAVDCAIWDWRAKRADKPISSLLGVEMPEPVETVFTISLDTPEAMAAAAEAAMDYGLLKLKLGRSGDVDRVAAIRAARPEARLIADANEGWDIGTLRANMAPLADLGVAMIEQPLPAGQDAELEGLERIVALGADESCHVTADLERVIGRYDLVNIKLDKTGGLTEALRLQNAAMTQGLDVMVGCMLGTSLAMAPAMLLSQRALYVDLDAPLLIGSDREPALLYDGAVVAPPEQTLWG